MSLPGAKRYDSVNSDFRSFLNQMYNTYFVFLITSALLMALDATMVMDRSHYGVVFRPRTFPHFSFSKRFSFFKIATLEHSGAVGSTGGERHPVKTVRENNPTQDVMPGSCNWQCSKAEQSIKERGS
ncbi:hypothetical protein CAPTEDRAFT_215686 [Capitella teleta]|uniref:Uncharacterized protein n=1 Tax=Capitella teleta TaxID=283909 RepID=R7TSA2_CAPTE|nr:hypothetical protein CAPTEDRAFT_215686 [Capitella teleta]|eukprot:ELT93900.1 hypothetical protein CAPTEDRAFT_215686 [Capitella teleta]